MAWLSLCVVLKGAIARLVLQQAVDGLLAARRGRGQRSSAVGGVTANLGVQRRAAIASATPRERNLCRVPGDL